MDGYPFQVFKNNIDPEELGRARITFKGTIKRQVWDAMKSKDDWFHFAGGFKKEQLAVSKAKNHKYFISIPLMNGQQFGFILPKGTDRKDIFKMYNVEEEYEDDGYWFPPE